LVQQTQVPAKFKIGNDQTASKESAKMLIVAGWSINRGATACCSQEVTAGILEVLVQPQRLEHKWATTLSKKL